MSQEIIYIYFFGLFLSESEELFLDFCWVSSERIGGGFEVRETEGCGSRIGWMLLGGLIQIATREEIYDKIDDLLARERVLGSRQNGQKRTWDRAGLRLLLTPLKPLSSRFGQSSIHLLPRGLTK